MLKKSKKGMSGNVPIDMIVIMIVFVFIIGFFVVIADKLNDSIQSQTQDTFNQTMLNQTNSALGVFDSGLPFIFFGFILAMLLLAWKLRSNPAFLLILIIIIAITVIIAAAISNTWFEVARSPSLVESSNDYPLSVYLIENMPLFIGVLGFLVLIFMFAKPKAEAF